MLCSLNVLSVVWPLEEVLRGETSTQLESSVRTAHARIISLSPNFNHLCRDLVANSGMPQVSGEGWRDGERE